MPRYVIERQYLVPVYEHILVEAADLETAYREALDDHVQPWGDDATTDYESARPTTISRAVELREAMCADLPADNQPDHHTLSQFLYDSELPALPIPAEFAEEREVDEPIGFS